MRSPILALGLGLLPIVAMAQPSPTPPAKTEPA
jgi:hypothetical protein